MRRSSRLFEIIQLLRAARHPLTARTLAERLEVSERTIYRDIAALQGMRTPVEGEAGVGYVMRRGYDLPPLNFDGEEVEALRVGLAMLARTGDGALQRAADRIRAKIESLTGDADWLQVAPWGAPLDDPEQGCIPKALLRDAVRGARKLRLTYRDVAGDETVRIVRPVAMIYHLDCVMLAAWCELRRDFRHFRADRIWDCDPLAETFADQQATLRALWQEAHGYQRDIRLLA
ncbi:MAG: YafY family transcriptional regulator [Pseudooceanicola sp.]|nr:YafY family transcriptional regulator [Pseudooceanicola sp.]